MANSNYLVARLTPSSPVDGVTFATYLEDLTIQVFPADAGAELWAQAARLGIPEATLDGLKLQGKFLYLTFNNAALAQKLQQDIGSADNLPQLADKDYHQPATWQNTLTALAGDGGEKALDALIPPIYIHSVRF